MERDSQYYIEKGYIDLHDDAEFRIITDAASCFGKQYKRLQRSYFRHPKERNKRLWFPKFYENRDWNNQISADESVIISKSNFSEKTKEEVNKTNKDEDFIVIVFAHEKNATGKLMYLFKGEYQLNQSETNYENGHVWERIGTSVKTYPSA